MTRFVHIYSATTNPINVDEAWIASDACDWVCRACNGVKKTAERIDVKLDSDLMPDNTLSFIRGYTIPIIHEDLLHKLPPDCVSQDLYLGNVILYGGTILNKWRTFRAKERLFIRGDKHVSHRHCNQCDRDYYYAGGRRYIYPKPVATTNIFDSDLGGLIVSKVIYDHMEITKKKGLFIEELPVAANPKDNLDLLYR